MADLGAEASEPQVLPADDQFVLDQICTLLQERPHLAFAVAQWMIPALTLAPTSAINGPGSRRFTGLICHTNPKQGFSFITSPEIKEEFGVDIFVHTAQRGNFGVNDTVSCAVLLNKDGKPQAFDVTPPHIKGGPAATYGSSVGSPKTNVPAAFSNAKGGTASAATFNSKGAKSMKGGMGGMDGMGGMGGLHAPVPTGKGAALAAAAAKGGKVGKHLDGQRYNGKISSFKPGGKYGFIQCDETFKVFGIDVWVHGQQIGDFNVEDQVSFKMILNKQGQPQAIDLQPAGAVEEISAPVESESELPEGRKEGVITRFAPNGKYGFLKCDETFAIHGIDVWVHSQQMGDFREGDAVTFTLTHNKQGHPQAIDLLAAGSASKKARLQNGEQGLF